jgi:hypothetical protein
MASTGACHARNLSRAVVPRHLRPVRVHARQKARGCDPGPSLFTQPADRLRSPATVATSRPPRRAQRPDSYGSWRPLTLRALAHPSRGAGGCAGYAAQQRLPSRHRLARRVAREKRTALRALLFPLEPNSE